MTIAIRSDANHRNLRYRVAGRLDLDSGDQVRAVEREAPPDSVVEIDLRDCDGMDDYGFGSLVGLIRRAREHRAHVHVLGAAPSVRNDLRRSGMERLVDFGAAVEVGDR